MCRGRARVRKAAGGQLCWALKPEKGVVKVPRGISAGLECTLRVPSSGTAGNGNGRSKGGSPGGFWGSGGMESLGGGGKLLTKVTVGTGSSEGIGRSS